MWSIALLWEMAGGGIDGAHKAVQATAEHREPCDSRGSCTVLGAPGGEIPPGDSTSSPIRRVVSQWLQSADCCHSRIMKNGARTRTGHSAQDQPVSR